MYYEPLPSYFVRLIRGFICPDRRLQRLSVGWGHVLERMMQHKTLYAWGVCMLSQLYHDLHQVVYDGATTLPT